MTVLLALLALVIGAGIAAAVLSLTGGGDSGPPKDVAKNVQVKGTLPQVVARGADPAIGVAAPQIAGTSLDGSPLAVTQDGHPHLLVVVAHWCPHCQATVPRLVQLNSQGALNGISVYGIATATSPDRPNYPPSDWLKRENWPFPTFADDSNSDIAHKLGVTGFPFFVLVDANGKVVGRLAGELTDAQFVALFQALAAGKPLPITFGGTSSPAP
ncbi:MAG TPA: TlpA disulfide reductase family protein [Acidimicrobiia bacterium]|nr:TlpA disulfide reductase family protein [Acidimicrobiia bacterium]